MTQRYYVTLVAAVDVAITARSRKDVRRILDAVHTAEGSAQTSVVGWKEVFGLEGGIRTEQQRGLEMASVNAEFDNGLEVDYGAIPLSGPHDDAHNALFRATDILVRADLDGLKAAIESMPSFSGSRCLLDMLNGAIALRDAVWRYESEGRTTGAPDDTWDSILRLMRGRDE